MMKYILLAAVLFPTVFGKCPNGCNGHGTCEDYDQCKCFNEEADSVHWFASDAKIGAICHQHNTPEITTTDAEQKKKEEKARKDKCDAEASKGAEYKCGIDPKDGSCKREVRYEKPKTLYPEWTGADCSRRTCPRSTSWTEVGDLVASKTYRCTHKIQVECSDQGVCDQATGLCECFPGFTGHACQRTACPDDCSGHGSCRSNRDFAYDFAVAKTHQLMQSHESFKLFDQNYVATYDDAWDSGHLYGCYCDKGYRGANCALVECPSSNDPLDDKCSDEEDAKAVENFQVQKWAATGSKGWLEAYALSDSKEQIKTKVCDTSANKLDLTGKKCRDSKGPNPLTDICVFTAPSKTNPSATCLPSGTWSTYAPGDKNNHFYDGKVYACFGAMSGMDCSGRGICDYSTGQCSCFSGYSGTSCSDIEELV